MRKNAVSTPQFVPTAEILLKTDKLSLTAVADKEGRIRLSCSSWEDARVMRPGQVVELRWQAGQVVMLRREGK